MNDIVNIPGYKIIRSLGVGGMASVYLAEQESLEREVALKVMAPALAANQEFCERFVKEGRITAKLSHPNLVTIYDIGSHGSTYYLAAEFIPCGTLSERLGDGMSVANAIDVVRDIALGLQYAHEKGFVHRDVKPGNILFRSNGGAVLADFGIAKAMDSTSAATLAGNSIGTPHYMSPEQARAERVDGRSDLYSLGAVLYQMLTGVPPYIADDPFSIALMHITNPVPVLPPRLAWLQPLIGGLMAKSPDDRFGNGEVFVAACDKLLATAPEGATVRDSHETRKRESPRLSNVQKQGVQAPPIAPGIRPAVEPPRGLPKFAVLAAASAVAVALALGIRVFIGSNDMDPPKSVVPPQPQVEQPVPRPEPEDVIVAPVPAPSSDVARLIATADEYVKIGFMENGRRLTAPDGDSAVDLYQQVLTLDPGNANASAGLDQIADYYESKAKAAYDRGLYTGSLILAEEGLKADPDSDGLKKLLEESRKAAGI